LASITTVRESAGARVKKLAIVLLLVAVGCHRKVEVRTAPPPANGAVGTNPTGAATPRAALEQFLAAAKSQDVQAFARIWGSVNGPIIATLPRDEIEQRSVILFCYLQHDSLRITRELAASGGERLVTADLRYKTVMRSADFITTRGKPNNLWYVKQFEPTTLNDICAASKR
jgi:hypothetical protein